MAAVDTTLPNASNYGPDTTLPSSSSSSSSSSSEPTWVQKLVTKEDKYHIHKTCGILWIVSVCFRFCLPSYTDMGFVSYPQLTIPTIVVHLLLVLSAFQFAIPVRRIASADRIWPEARIHATVFSCRSLANLLLIWYENKYNVEEPNYDLNLAIVLLSMALADWGSYSVGKHHSKTIRDIPNISPRLKFNFSSIQMMGTNNCLFGFRRFGIHYLSVLVIQGYSFVLTLRRKNVISTDMVTYIYSGLLIIGSIITLNDLWIHGGGFQTYLAYLVTAHTATILRLGPRIPGLRIIQNNKYLLWLGLGLFLRQYRSWLVSDETSAMRFRLIHLVVSVVIITWMRNSKSDDVISCKEAAKQGEKFVTPLTRHEKSD